MSRLPLSLERVHVRTAPFLHRVARMAAPVSLVLRAATTPHRPSRSVAVVPCLGDTVAAPRSYGDGEASQVPGEPSCSFAAFFDPGRTSVPSPEDDPSQGVAVDRWPSPLPVPHSARVAGSPPRGTSVLPPLRKTTRAPAMSSISGLYHAASELAVYASQSASRRPTQDSLAAGGQPFAARDWLPAGLHRSFNHSLHGILFSRLGLAQFPRDPELDSPEGCGVGRRATLGALAGASESLLAKLLPMTDR
jgi:hypothetical protein